METKQCKRCLEHRSLELFRKSKNINNKKRESYVCFYCLKTTSGVGDQIPNKEVYEAFRKSHNDAKKEYRNRNRKAIYEYLLENPCVDCGETNPIVLEFDHINPEEKSFGIARGLDRSLEKLFEEIAKCEVRCANCHRIKTAKDFNYLMLGF